MSAARVSERQTFPRRRPPNPQIAEIVVPDLKSYERLLTDKLLTLPTVDVIRSNVSLRPAKVDAPLPLPG